MLEGALPHSVIYFVVPVMKGSHNKLIQPIPQLQEQTVAANRGLRSVARSLMITSSLLFLAKVESLLFHLSYSVSL